MGGRDPPVERRSVRLERLARLEVESVMSGDSWADVRERRPGFVQNITRAFGVDEWDRCAPGSSMERMMRRGSKEGPAYYRPLEALPWAIGWGM